MIPRWLSGRVPGRTLGGLALALAVGCGGSNPKPADVTSTTVTSATVPASEQAVSNRVAQLEYERDRARDRADTAERIAAAQRERSDFAMRAVEVRNDFEDRVGVRLDRIDARVRSLRADAANAPAAQRKKILAALPSIEARCVEIERTMRHVHTIPPIEWPLFTRDVTRAVDAIARDLETLKQTSFAP